MWSFSGGNVRALQQVSPTGESCEARRTLPPLKRTPMLRRRSKKLILLFFGDCFLLYLALYATLYLRYRGTEDADIIIARHVTPFTLVFIIWLLTFGAFGLYELRLMKNERHFLYRLIQAMVLNI